MREIKYAIAILGHPNPCNCSFVSQLAHEFKGMTDVLGYNNLEQALKWDIQEDAERCLAELPSWACGKHEVVKIENTGLGWRYFHRHRE